MLSPALRTPLRSRRAWTGGARSGALRAAIRWRRSATSLRLLTSAHCSLCEDMHDVLDEARRREPFELEEVDIRSDAVTKELRRRFQYDVPVLLAEDGEVVAKHRLDADRLVEWLRTRPKGVRGVDSMTRS